MGGLDSLIEHQGFYDYLNHFISGSLLLLGAEGILRIVELSPIEGIYKGIGLLPVAGCMSEFLWNTCVIALFVLLTFLLGSAVQELYDRLYEDRDAGKEDGDSKTGWIGSIFRDHICHKPMLQTYTKRLLDNQNGPIFNEYKRKRYEQLKEEFATEVLGLSGKKEVNQESLSMYFYGHCVYYLQIRNQNRKMEKLRDIEGLSKALSLVFLILACFSFVIMWVSFWEFGKGFPLLVISFLACMCATVLMDHRTEKTMKYRIRMTLGVYDVEKQREASEQDAERDRDNKRKR